MYGWSFVVQDTFKVTKIAGGVNFMVFANNEDALLDACF
jgi:hypothetical protein